MPESLRKVSSRDYSFLSSSSQPIIHRKYQEQNTKY